VRNRVRRGLGGDCNAIPGKGLGIVALQYIPAAYRIIVEGGVEKTHPRVVELLPHNGSLLDAKYDLNRVGCGIDDEDHDELSILCLQISRMNHSFAINASHYYDSSVKVRLFKSI